MNKADVIDHLSTPLGSRQAATVAVEALVDVVIREVAAGGSVGITGFGTFERADRAPRTGRNPRTGDRVPIPGTSSPRFRPGTYFKEVVSEPEHLPAEGRAGGRAPVRAQGDTTSRSTKAEKKPAKAKKDVAGKGATAGSGPDTNPPSKKRDTKPAKKKSESQPSGKKTPAKKSKASDKQPTGQKASAKKSKSKKQSRKK